MASKDMTTLPFGWRHAWIVGVASMGQLIGTGVATLAGIIIPLLNIMSHHELTSMMQGIIGSMDLIGIVLGSVFFGKLIDRFGYILFFRLCPTLVLVGVLISIFFPTVPMLIISLFIIGVGIGGEYSLDSNYISELLPEKWKSFMVGLAKSASALGNILVAGVSYFIIRKWENADRWPQLMWIVVVLAAIMIISRIWYYQSPKWLEQHGDRTQAAKDLSKFLGADVTFGPDKDLSDNIVSSSGEDTEENIGGKGSFFRENWKKIILTGIPWSCEGLGVYGIGVFLPILVMSLGIESDGSGTLPISHVDSSVLLTFFISCIILPGFLIGLFLIKKNVDILRLQISGFWLCTASLAVLLLAYHYGWHKWVSIAAFMMFELCLNMGPHLVTYILPTKVYPVEVRGFGSGLAASLGKVGAVAGVFFIPLLLDAGGCELVLIVSALTMMVGAVITKVLS